MLGAVHHGMSQWSQLILFASQWSQWGHRVWQVLDVVSMSMKWSQRRTFVAIITDGFASRLIRFV